MATKTGFLCSIFKSPRTPTAVLSQVYIFGEADVTSCQPQQEVAVFMAPDDHKELATFGSRLKALRKARGLALGKAAAAVDVSRTSFGMWEKDSVKNPDVNKLVTFTKMADCTLDWLLRGIGKAPDLTPRKASSRSVPRSDDMMEVEAAPEYPHMPPSPDDVPEINPLLTAHATGLDLQPRAAWHIPAAVLELAFHATPGRVVMKRVSTREGGDFGIARGDYVLIDTSRNQMDEPGTYILGDPEGRCARRALVEAQDGALKIVVLADDTTRPNVTVDDHEHVVLGRIMGIFKPV